MPSNETEYLMGSALGNYSRLFANCGHPTIQGCPSQQGSVSWEEVKIAGGRSTRGERGSGRGSRIGINGVVPDEVVGKE